MQVDPDEEAALVDALVRVLGDRAVPAELEVRGLARAKLYTWEQTARQTLALYDRVLGQ